MAMNFDIPDISETAGKAATGGRKRKTRKIGALRLGDALRMIANHFTCTEESRDEDKNIAFYSLSDGEEKASFYGEAGEAQASSAMDIFADTVTSIFVTRPAKGDKSFTIALMDSEAAKALSDQAAVEAEEKKQAKGPLGRLFSTFFDPVGRISRRSYIPKMLTVGIPAVFMFAFTCFKPELFVGDANVYIMTFLILGTLCFISLISLAMRRMSDLGLSHIYYWIFFAILFAINQLGGEYLGSQLTATRTIAVIFMAAVILLSFFPGQNKKNKYGPVPKD